MLSPSPWKMHGFSHQFPIASIPDTLELKAKYIKRRREHRCYFVKKEEYKYTLGKSISPYTKLFLLLTISFKNYKTAGKCPRVITSKDIVNSIHTFYCHVMLWLFFFTNFSLSFVGTVVLSSLTL